MRVNEACRRTKNNSQDSEKKRKRGRGDEIKAADIWVKVDIERYIYRVVELANELFTL
jgi:hypothetical protein